MRLWNSAVLWWNFKLELEGLHILFMKPMHAICRGLWVILQHLWKENQEDLMQNVWLCNGEARRNHHQRNGRQKILGFPLCFTGNMRLGSRM